MSKPTTRPGRAVSSRIGQAVLMVALFLSLGACGGRRQPAGARSPEAPAVSAAARPNVLFMVIDDLKADLGCAGSVCPSTPSLDALARRGMRFSRAYAQFTVCNPSRVSFLTGLRPDTTRVRDHDIWFRDRLPDVVTLPHLFRANGYHTKRVGKVFHGGRDMDDHRAWDEVSYPSESTRLGRSGHGRNLTSGRIPWCYWRAAAGGDDDQPDGQIAAEAVDFLRQGTPTPFFLALGFHMPHQPYIVPERYFDLYRLDEIVPHQDPPGFAPVFAGAMGATSLWSKIFARFTDKDRREFVRAYFAATSFVDAQIGKVLDALKEAGLEESTIVVVLGDHGFHLGEQGWWNKNTLYESSARAPLLVAVPSMAARGGVSARLVELVDIYPTLAELSSLTPPPGLEGRSLVPLLDDPALPWKEIAFTQVQRRGQLSGRSVRTPRWRYTEWIGPESAVELYDHENDPGEYTNLAGSPEHTDVVARLRLLLRQGAGGDRRPPAAAGARRNPTAALGD